MQRACARASYTHRVSGGDLQGRIANTDTAKAVSNRVSRPPKSAARNSEATRTSTCNQLLPLERRCISQEAQRPWHTRLGSTTSVTETTHGVDESLERQLRRKNPQVQEGVTSGIRYLGTNTRWDGTYPPHHVLIRECPGGHAERFRFRGMVCKSR